MTLEELKKNSIFAVGGENVDYAQYFDGMSYLNMLSLKQVIVGNVTFEPACRNHWHIHHASEGGGQMLLVTAGAAGTRNGANRLRNSIPATSSTFRPTSNTGTVPPKTVLSSTWPLKFPVRIRVLNGAKPFLKPITISFRKAVPYGH